MAFAAVGAFQSWSNPSVTANAGTAFKSFVPPKKRARTKILTMRILMNTTAHTYYVLRPLGKTTVAKAAANAATTLVITRDPGNYSANAILDGRPVPSVANNLIAASDQFAFQLADGNWSQITASAVATNTDGTVTLTVAALAGAVNVGARFYWFGISTDTDPNTGLAHPSFVPPVSGTAAADGVTPSGIVTYGGDGSAIAQTVGLDEPLLVINANATGASILDQLSGIYGP